MAQKILIVEDELNIIVALRFSLEQKGYDVIVAVSGEEALEKIARERPDLILLDIMLPGIDGYEVCENVRQNKKTQNTRIVFLSAMGRDVDVAKGAALAADAYFVKPFSILEVIDKVRELLEDQEA